eukprot:scaffold140_cov565-Prasinococcus_capsulatus_cf.AAC.3
MHIWARPSPWMPSSARSRKRPLSKAPRRGAAFHLAPRPQAALGSGVRACGSRHAPRRSARRVEWRHALKRCLLHSTGTALYSRGGGGEARTQGSWRRALALSALVRPATRPRPTNAAPRARVAEGRRGRHSGLGGGAWLRLRATARVFGGPPGGLPRPARREGVAVGGGSLVLPGARDGGAGGGGGGGGGGVALGREGRLGEPSASEAGRAPRRGPSQGNPPPGARVQRGWVGGARLRALRLRRFPPSPVTWACAPKPPVAGPGEHRRGTRPGSRPRGECILR